MSKQQAHIAIVDAVDFYEQWPILRQRAEKLVETQQMTKEDALLLHWMIRMVDMVGPRDIPSDDSSERR